MSCDGQVLKRDMDQLDAWLDVRRPVLEDRTLGDSIDAVEEQLQKHDDFENMILAQEERFNSINRTTLVLLLLLVYHYQHYYCNHFTALWTLSGATRVSQYQKGRTNLGFTDARDTEWQWHQLGRMQICTLAQTDNHASTPPLSVLQAGCPSCRPTNRIIFLMAGNNNNNTHLTAL